ncbi:MAG: glycosyltransferase family 39 protein [Chloroflexi bacterium]|nr:glycosyltransferase family 39 protein [Chloroflexota bacterium]
MAFDSHDSSLSFPARLIILLLILFLGWALRTHALETRSLWEDEGWTMLLSKGPGLGAVTRTLAADQHPPLYFVLFRLWRNMTGDTEFAGRYFGVLIGMIATAGMVPLGRMMFGQRAGILAALVMALADLPIDLSQEIRHYQLLLAGIIWCSLFYIRWWRTPSRFNRIGYVLAGIALLYTHYLGGFILLAQAIHMLLTVRPRRRLVEAILLLGAIGLGFLPWLPVVIDQNSVRWDNPLYYQNSLPNSLDTYHAVRTALFGKYFALMGGLALWGLVYWTYREDDPVSRRRTLHAHLRARWPMLYLVVWIGLMVGLTVWINDRRQFLTVRNFVLITPPLALLIGRGLSNLPGAARWFMVSLVIVMSLTTIDSRRHYPDWRAVTQNVTRYHLDSEPVLMDIWVGDFPARYYIDRQMGATTPRVSLREWRDQYQTLFLPTLLDYLQRQDAFWLIYWGDKPMDEYGSLIDQSGFQRTAALHVDHLGTPLYSYRYDKITGEPTATFAEMFALQKFSAADQVRAGQNLTVSLWWTALQTPPLDYSVSVFLLDQNGALAAQHDGPPLAGTSPTSTWQPGALKYDIHTLALGPTLPPGTYQLGVKLYWYGDQLPLTVKTPTQAAGEYAILGSIELR